MANDDNGMKVRAYVANFPDEEISVIDRKKERLITNVKTESIPH
jgi:DNA-binding beta-propeller fold protein YncE